MDIIAFFRYRKRRGKKKSKNIRFIPNRLVILSVQSSAICSSSFSPSSMSKLLLIRPREIGCPGPNHPSVECVCVCVWDALEAGGSLLVIEKRGRRRW